MTGCDPARLDVPGIESEAFLGFRTSDPFEIPTGEVVFHSYNGRPFRPYTSRHDPLVPASLGGAQPSIRAEDRLWDVARAVKHRLAARSKTS